MKVLNDGVGEEFAAGGVNLSEGGFLVSAREFDFEVFADVHGLDTFIAHVLKGALDGFTLGVEDRFLWRNDNFGFHFRRGGMLQGNGRDASKKEG